MPVQIWLRLLKARLTGNHTPRNTGKRPAHRWHLEALEDRCVPAPIDGTPGNDTFIVTRDANQVTVNMNGNLSTHGPNSPLEFDGKSGYDRLVVAGAGPNTWQLTGTNSGTITDKQSFTSFEAIISNTGTDTLVGPATDNMWQFITMAESYVNGIGFGGFQTIQGGAGNDTFEFAVAPDFMYTYFGEYPQGGLGQISGMIDGGLGDNVLDFRQFSVPADWITALNINIIDRTIISATLGFPIVGSFDNISAIKANNNANFAGFNSTSAPVWVFDGSEGFNVDGIKITGMSHGVGGPGNDHYIVNGTSVTGLTLDGSVGSDTYAVYLGNLLGPVTISDSSGASDTLTVHGTTQGDDLPVSGTFVRWRPAGDTGDYREEVVYAGIEQVTVNAGAGDDILRDPLSTNVTLLGDVGNDIFFITDTFGPVTADGGNGNNTFIVTMGNLAGPVTISNTVSTSTLTVIAPAGSNTLTLSVTQLTGAGETINLNLGSTATSITVDGSAGTNQLELQGPPPGPVTVQNITILSPIVGTIAAPVDPVRVGIGITASAGVTDANAMDTHTAVWDWGDSTTSAGTVNESSGSGSVSGSHTYVVPGVYTIILTVTDNTGRTGYATFQYVVAYDPSAGFVTGGGWINSPAGAYVANPSLAGKANFGFESRYQNGNSVPTGNTEFQFKVANFNFKSTSYEWLVVSGAKARYRGVGTVNGVAGYGFELTAWDGQANGGGGTDRFRIKIWNANQGNGVVYDNQMGAADGADPTTTLGGGSIVIHRQDPLMAAGGPRSLTVGAPTQRLSAAALQPILAAAIDRWAVAGLDAARLNIMRNAIISIADLGGSYLGLGDPGTYAIRIDDDAAGYGWFVDATPGEDSEFRRPGDRRVRGRMDLLSAVAHELGHLVGLDDDHNPGRAGGVMGDSLAAGTRRMPAAVDVVPASADHVADSFRRRFPRRR